MVCCVVFLLRFLFYSDFEETGLLSPDICSNEPQAQDNIPLFDDFSFFFPETCVPIKLESTAAKSSDSSSSVMPDTQPNKKRRRQRPPNPDADLIAEATEANMKLYDIDPNTKEGRKQKRQIRNRLSAQIHRDRKKEYIESLERRVAEREAMIKDMETKMDILIQENNMLRNEIVQLQPHRTFGPSHSHPRCYSASSTTSESDDDSVSSRWSGEGTRKSIPLLSLVFLLGFVFFGIPLDDLSTSLPHSVVSPSPPTVWSEKHHGRVLLDDPDHFNGQLTPYYMLPQSEPIQTLTPLTPLPVSPHWKVQSRLMNVFPRVQVTEQRVHVKRNLRSRTQKGGLRDNSTDQNGAVVEWHPDEFSHGDYSRVRLTDGAALLHPQLLSALPAASTENLQQETQKAVTRWTGVGNVANAPTADNNSPSLLMVMPASLVQWGAVWQEQQSDSDKQDIMRALLRGMNWTDVSGLNGDENLPGDLSSIWIEIGCTVNRVQIVHNVTQI